MLPIIILDKSNLDKTNNGRPDLTEVSMSKVTRGEFVKVGLGGVAGVAAPSHWLMRCDAQPVQSPGGTLVPTPH